MIVLDTNVVSELVRPRPDPAVIAWLDGISGSQLTTTTVTVGEIAVGIARMPEGRRKQEVAIAVGRMLGEELSGRAEPYDLGAAGEYGRLVADRLRSGRPISVADAQIAAICRAVGATLATRNVADFEGTGIDLVNPWTHVP